MITTMKKAAYIVSFFVIITVLIALYYTGYYFTEKSEFSSNLLTKEEVEKENPAIYNVSNVDEQIITKNTEYIIETYNSDTEDLSVNTENVPIEILGYDREKMTEYIEKKRQTATEKNVINMQLKSFSGDKVVVRKTIVNLESIYHYYVVSEDNVIKIYNSDKKQLFTDTGISTEDLNEESREKLKQGFYIETIHELYNYLESVTS